MKHRWGVSGNGLAVAAGISQAYFRNDRVANHLDLQIARLAELECVKD